MAMLNSTLLERQSGVSVAYEPDTDMFPEHTEAYVPVTNGGKLVDYSVFVGKALLLNEASETEFLALQDKQNQALADVDESDRLDGEADSYESHEIFRQSLLADAKFDLDSGMSEPFDRTREITAISYAKYISELMLTQSRLEVYFFEKRLERSVYLEEMSNDAAYDTIFAEYCAAMSAVPQIEAQEAKPVPEDIATKPIMIQENVPKKQNRALGLLKRVSRRVFKGVASGFRTKNQDYS